MLYITTTFIIIPYSPTTKAHYRMIEILIFLLSIPAIALPWLYNRIINNHRCLIWTKEAETAGFQQNNTKTVQYITNLSEVTSPVCPLTFPKIIGSTPTSKNSSSANRINSNRSSSTSPVLHPSFRHQIPHLTVNLRSLRPQLACGELQLKQNMEH